jgi:hypothetical protein
MALRMAMPIALSLLNLEESIVGAEAGIVLRGIAERLDRSGDSSAIRSRPLDAHLFLFVSFPRSVVQSNTLLTPGAPGKIPFGESGGFSRQSHILEGIAGGGRPGGTSTLL